MGACWTMQLCLWLHVHTAVPPLQDVAAKSNWRTASSTAALCTVFETRESQTEEEEEKRKEKKKEKAIEKRRQTYYLIDVITQENILSSAHYGHITICTLHRVGNLSCSLYKICQKYLKSEIHTNAL